MAGGDTDLLGTIHLAVATATPEERARAGVTGWLQGCWATGAAAGLHLPEGDLPLDPPVELPAEEVYLRNLAARTGDDGWSRARMFRAHDVVGIAMRLRPGMVAPPSIWWAALPPGAMGSVTINVATAPRPADLAFAEVLSATGLDREPGLRLGGVTRDGVVIAEVEQPDARRFGVVAPQDEPGLVDQLTWDDSGDLGSLLRYLVHATKLRYHVGVFHDALPTLRARESRLDDTLEELFVLHAALEGERGHLERSIFDAHSRLGRAHGESAGIVMTSSRLDDLHRSAATAVHNLKANLPPMSAAIAPGGSTSFDRDIGLGTWLGAQIEQEQGYLGAVRERVLEAQRLTTLRLEQATEEQARLANWLSVLQTSVLAAFLGSFSAIGALGDPPFTVGNDLKWAVFVTVPVLAVVLPALALRWVRGIGRYDFLGAAACGATVGWTAAVAAGVSTPVAGGAAGAFAVVSGAAVRARRLEQMTPRSTATAAP
ncbi:MAG: hypothetical protein H0W25_06080 [Acidimicrobiia bacterium]|nr:hypothetical protein [Acidimicrobiia bacterium]